MTSTRSVTPQEDRSQRYRIALDCVHCGLCLSACPTYHVTGLEAASPRGRIYLMRAFEEGRQPDTAALREHIESCLVCRACEPVCPSGVRFGTMMEEFRALVRGQLESQPAGARDERQHGWAARFGTWLLESVVPHRRRLRRLVNLLWVVQRTGLAALARHLRLLRLFGLEQAERLAPRLPSPWARRGWPEVLPAHGTRRARVLFLRGCVTPELLPSMQSASIEVLRRNGCEVVTPPQQTCCGALHFHAGRRRRGLELLQQNLVAFDVADVDAIIVNAAGCGSTMKDYASLVGEASPLAEAARRMSEKVRDISEFLDELGLTAPLHPLPLRVAWDAPCHLLHGQRIEAAPLRLLHRIPKLDVVPLVDSDRCCGSAGLYSLLHPELAQELGEEKATRIREAHVDVVATGNSGCILQIAGALRRTRAFGDTTAPVEVLHVVELLQRASADAD
jgi:glycolate oxidase iron-sulfur subunit